MLSKHHPSLQNEVKKPNLICHYQQVANKKSFIEKSILPQITFFIEKIIQYHLNDTRIFRNFAHEKS